MSHVTQSIQGHTITVTGPAPLAMMLSIMLAIDKGNGTQRLMESPEFSEAWKRAVANARSARNQPKESS